MKRKKQYCIQGHCFLQYCFILLWVFSFEKLNAQNNSTKYLRFTRHNFLATNQVNCIAEDKKKFIWFATSNGIQRFDGIRWLWLTQKKNSTTSLPDNNVDFLLEDKQERFWVQTSAGISLLNRNNLEFTPVGIAWLPADSLHDIQSLVSLKDGLVWLTSAAGQLYFYDAQHKQFVSGGNIVPAAGRFVFQLTYDSIHHQYVLATDSGIVLYDLTDKAFYTSTHNPKNNLLLQTKPAKQPVATIYLNDSAQLWFSNFSVHTCYNIKTNKLLFCDSVSTISGILGYTTDRSGNTWSYGATIARMNFVSGRAEPIEQTPDQLYGINFQNGGFFMEDSENTYWMATTNGVFIYNRFQQQFIQHSIKSYSNGTVFSHINVWGFIDMPDSSIAVLTTRGEGLYFFDNNFKQLPSKFNLSAFATARGWVNIRCGTRDADGHLYVACEKGPLLKLYPENGRVEKIEDSVFTGLGFYSMAKDKEGNIYFGTFRQAVIRRDAATGKFSRVGGLAENNKELDNVFNLFYDGNKYLWAATSKSGLLKINTLTNKVEKIYINNPANQYSFPGKQVFAVTGSAFNQLLLSTELGIVNMDPAKETFTLLNTADGLPDNNVVSIVNGGQRNAWFASDNGISKMKLDGMKTTSYGILEGLTNENFNVGAATALSSGQLLFGHNEGFTSLDPAAYLHEHKPADVSITGIRLFDRYLNIDSILTKGNGLQLNYSQNFLTIEFSNMSLLNRYHTVYYYQLEGVDDGWKIANGMPQATYTYLPGGNYTFKVQCATRTGINSEAITTFKITIIPPVWKQWWFYVLGALAVSTMVYLFFRTRYQQKLEAEKGRSRIAKDLHDDMGSTLSTINILSEMAKTKIDTDIPTTKKFIHQISDNSNRIMESLDDIVWNIDTANDSIENTFSRMREFAGNLLEARGIVYTFNEDDRIKNINLELGRRHDFFMIFKEAVNNLAKYSACTTVVIDLAIKKNMLVLKIADDGKGFESNARFEGNGLSNMQQRAQALKGHLSIDSAIAAGTTVQLTVPL